MYLGFPIDTTKYKFCKEAYNDYSCTVWVQLNLHSDSTKILNRNSTLIVIEAFCVDQKSMLADFTELSV
jgi:predicted CoA-binding protein